MHVLWSSATPPGELFVKRTRIPASAEAVFAWHARPGAFQKLTPPWEPVKLVTETGGIGDGARVELRIGRGPFRMRWVAVHEGYIEGRQFRDVQVSGPFVKWVHTHRFEPDGPDASYLEDRVEYELPFGRLGRLFGGTFARKKIARMFDYRHAVTLRELTAGIAARPGLL